MTVINILSVYLLCAVFCLGFLGRYSRMAKFVALIAIAAILWLPVDDNTAIAFLASFFGELSVMSLILLGSALIFRISKIRLVSRHDFKMVMAFSAIVGAVFYFSALTPSTMDYYEAGYGYTLASWAVWGMILLCGLIALKYNCYSLLLIFCLASLAYAFDIYQSSNFWDYLIDAPLFVYSLYFWIKLAGKNIGVRITGMKHQG